MHKSGRSKFENKLHWVRWHLFRAGYLDQSKRGVWTLTEKGRNAPSLSDQEVHQLLLDVQRGGRVPSGPYALTELPSGLATGQDEEEPEEVGYKVQLLQVLRALPPGGFERLCQRLLRESGFEEVVVTGRTGDGGIDGHGVLRVNPFVAFKILFQCKKYSGKVGSPDIRDFRGALQGRADKGIVLTTSSFSADAHKEAIRDGVPPIELIDGEQLVKLFEEMELGLRPRTTYDLDPSFFDQFREEGIFPAS